MINVEHGEGSTTPSSPSRCELWLTGDVARRRQPESRMFDMPFFPTHQKSRKQVEEEERQKVADDFEETLKKMTPSERKAFWKQHDEDTSRDG